MSKEQPVTFKPLLQGRIADATHKRNVWYVTPEHGVTIDDMLKVDFWQHVTGQLRPTDRIEAWAEDQSWMAEFVVVQVERAWAKVHLLVKHQMGGLMSEKKEQDYYVKWRGPHGKYAAMRADGTVMKDRFENAEDAESYIRGIPRAVAA